jgi:LmbE family N-acetylglucosaminyl deacetylase
MKGFSKFLLRSFSRAARPYLKSVGLLQTAKVFNRSTLIWEPSDEKVLVLAPHMDDEVIGCGGTLAKHVARGAHVTVAFLTDGGAGSAVLDASRSSTTLTETRTREAQRALATLGIQSSVFLGAEDGHLTSAPPLVNALRALLVRHRFDLVYLPFFLEEHPDHRAASQILLDAAHGADVNPQCLAYEVWTPLFPNCLVNIDETLELKRAALNHYRSQLSDVDYAHTQFGLNAYRSAALLGGQCRYAEAFCSLSLVQYRTLHHSYLSPPPTDP